MNGTNLIPRERVAEKKCRAHVRRWALACCAYGLVVASAAVVTHSVLGGEEAQLGGQLESTTARIEKLKATIDSLSQKLAEAEGALEAGRAIGNQPDWSALLGVLGTQLGEDVVLDLCRLLPVGAEAAGGKLPAGPGPSPLEADVSLGRRSYKLELGGFGRTQRAVSLFVLRLERLDFFQEVKLVRSNRQGFRASEAVAFKVECLI